MLSPGDAAPSFDLPASTGGTISLADLTKDGPAVVYFYPKADTPGCTTQACDVSENLDAFNDLNATIVGVSPDPIAKVEKFAGKYDLKFPLLADEDHAVCEAYGTWQEKSMYGKKYWGATRSTFIINDGRITHVFEKVKPKEHVREVTAALSGA